MPKSEWKEAPRGQNEDLRLARLERYAILDTAPEQDFDDIVLLATQLCATPVALVSLVASDRQWFKARVGFDPRETPLSQSVCAHALGRPGLLVIPDLTRDDRTRENTLVTGPPHIRFYAAARLETPEGDAIGTLCVIDSKPRPGGLTESQGRALAALARQVMAQLELRRTSATLEARVTQQALERSRTWQVSPDLLSVIDIATGAFDRVNPAWSAALGWKVAEIEGRIYRTFIHPDDLERTGQASAVVQRGDPVLRFENRYRHVDGSYKWLSWVSVPEGGKVYSSARDITEDKARGADRDRLWRLSTDVMLIADFQSRIVAVNPAWASVTGWSEAELIGQAFMSLVHPDDVASTNAEVGKLSEGATTFSFENRYRRKDGGYCTLAWTAVPDERFIHAIGRDITAEKESRAELAKTQEALRQSQKMEAVGQLTGGLAHDFNNLLAVISGSLELTERAIVKGKLKDTERFLSTALAATKRAASLTHRLLAFSRRQTLTPTPTDINELVAGMDDMIRRAVGPAIDVEVDGAEGLWTTLVDRNQLESALLNLCLNAKDAMPDGGRLTIAAANHWFDDNAAADRDLAPGAYISLCVGDTGRGMAPDVIAKAFDPFFTTKPLGEGTGLGLSMVYGFARQSDGQVRIDSQVGKGSVICIYLPRHIGAVPSDPDTSPPKPERADKGQSVLVIDDEPGVRMLVVEVLEELGYDALEASDGVTGLNVVKSKARIDLIVTDVGLPGGMNGRQLAEASLMLRPELKVLFITGYADSAATGHGPLGDGMAMMTKPFAMDALANRIKELLAPR